MAAAPITGNAVGERRNFLLGLWLVIAPWVLGYSSQDNAVWNHIGIGAAIALIALVRMTTPETSAPLSLVNVTLGGWVIVAPFVLNYNSTTNADAIYWNDVLVGVAVVILGLISSAGPRRLRGPGSDGPATMLRWGCRERLMPRRWWQHFRLGAQCCYRVVTIPAHDRVDPARQWLDTSARACGANG